MEPISVALLAALAGGAGGEVGRQAWAGLSALVQRPFRHGSGGRTSPVSSGETELVRLALSPDDQERAHALSMALAVRYALDSDSDFRSALNTWYARARLVNIGDGAVHNTISGGTQHGPVLQGRDFSGLTFTTAPAPEEPPATPPARD